MMQLRRTLRFGALLATISAATAHRTRAQQPDSSLRRTSIAIMTIDLPSWLSENRRDVAILDSLITGELTTAGYRVIGVGQAGTLRRHVIDSLGGIFDTRTGRRDGTRSALADRLVDLVLQDSLKADVKLYATVIARPVSFVDNSARWDGASEEIQQRRFLSQLLTPSAGTAPGLSLMTELRDFSGRVLHKRYGGIRLLYRLQDGRFVEVTKDSLLDDRALDRAAIHRALDSLLTGRRVSLDRRAASAEAVGGCMTPIGGRDDLVRRIVCFDSLISLYPGSAEAYEHRGFARVKLGDTLQAVTDLTTAVSIRPDYGDAYFNRGLIRFSMGDTNRTLADMTSAVRHGATAASVAHLLRGAIFYSRSQLDSSFAALDEAIALNPGLTLAYGTRAEVYGSWGSYAREVHDLDTVIARMPDNAAAYATRARALRELGYLDRAIADDDLALSHQPDLLAAYIDRALALEAKGMPARAEADYSAGIKAFPNADDAYLYRGDFYRRQGDSARASHDFAMAQRIAHDSNGVRVAAGRLSMANVADLTGTWRGDDGATYYVSQADDIVWWVAMSAPNGSADFHRGLEFATVFRGEIRGDTVQGRWVDVPRGRRMQTGLLRLVVAHVTTPTPSLELRRAGGSHEAAASRWWRVPRQPVPPCDSVSAPSPEIGCKLARVRAVGGYSLGNDFQSYLDNVVVYGRVAAVKANAPRGGGTYLDLVCNRAAGGGATTQRSGNFSLSLIMDPSYDAFGWDNQWSFHPRAEWLGSRQTILSKLAFPSAPDSSRPLMHAELIPFGRAMTGGRCTSSDVPVLPGWLENGGSSVLLNGAPIAGNLGSRGLSLGGRSLAAGTHVRIVGLLGLDCTTRGCADDDSTVKNVVVRPVYSIDVLDDSAGARAPRTLTGVWAATDVATYYIRQIGDSIWWLGLSHDRGRTFTNVFHGAIRGDTIEGDWSDVPLGRSTNGGTLVLQAGSCPGSNCAVPVPGVGYQIRTIQTENGIFDGYRWRKLYDVPETAPRQVTGTARSRSTSDPR